METENERMVYLLDIIEYDHDVYNAKNKKIIYSNFRTRDVD